MDNADIMELRDRVQALPTLEKKRAAMQREYHSTVNEVSEMQRRYKQEHGDVEQLEKSSLSSFLLKMTGRYEDKLEREQQEVIDAKLAFDRANARLESLTEELDSLKLRIDALKEEDKRYQEILSKRRSELSESNGQNAERFAEIEQERKEIISQITEIKEAQSVLSRVKSTANGTRESLKKAQSWATYDAFTRGGIISHLAKYEHIDSAQYDFNVLSSLLRSLKTELADVNGISTSGLQEISSTQRTVDFWFDNIFTDLSVRSQIKDNTAQIDSLLSSLRTVESTLGTKLRECESKLAVNHNSEEELLVSI